jgi:hypothetical protein
LFDLESLCMVVSFLSPRACPSIWYPLLSANTPTVGAIKIEKRSAKTGNPLASNAGAVFSYDGQSENDNGDGDPCR